MNGKSIKGLCGVAATVAVLIWLAACAGVHRGRSVQESGFLTDYAQLQPGKRDQEVLVYINPKTNFNQYHRLILEPVRAYTDEDSKFGKLSPEDLQKLLDYFDATLRMNLGPHLTFVKEPGPDVMRLRVAMTEERGAHVVLDIVSSVLPPAIAINALKTIATGRGTGIGEASAEFEVIDSQTGERLAASVDKRVGNKYTGEFDKFEKWRATQAACDYWAKQLTIRLAELRSGQAM